MNSKDLNSVQEQKLNEFFEKIVDRASIDYNDLEFQDIQTAVERYLQFAVSKINTRDIFRVSRIQSCGSMAEKTSIWKWGNFGGDYHTEFDFLAVLEDSVRLEQIIRDQNDCSLCMRVKTPPLKIHIPSVRCDSKSEDEFVCKCNCRKIMTTSDFTANAFLYELNKCLISSCKCYKTATEARQGKMAHHDGVQTGCHKCVIEMPTGYLKVLFPPNRDMLDSRCSVGFLWTSKANSLSVPGVTLQRNQQISSLPVHVDFLPVIEILSSGSALNRHECFLVPKLCRTVKEFDTWKKSSCMAEICAMTNASTTHIKAYKVMKYVVGLMKESALISQYVVKNNSASSFRFMPS